MAIDSAEKRRSVAGVGFWVVGPGVTPNASKDAEWRQQAGWGYSGILAAVAVVVVAAFSGGAGLGMLDKTQTRWKRRQATWRKRR